MGLKFSFFMPNMSTNAMVIHNHSYIKTISPVAKCMRRTVTTQQVAEKVLQKKSCQVNEGQLLSGQYSCSSKLAVIRVVSPHHSHCDEHEHSLMCTFPSAKSRLKKRREIDTVDRRFQLTRWTLPHNTHLLVKLITKSNSVTQPSLSSSTETKLRGEALHIVRTPYLSFVAMETGAGGHYVTLTCKSLNRQGRVNEGRVWRIRN